MKTLHTTQKSRECVQWVLITPRVTWFVVKHRTFGRVLWNSKKCLFLGDFPAFSEGTLQKWLPDMISGAIFEVFFAILARRVGCTTKPFWERKKHPNAVLFNPQCHMFQCTHRSEMAKMCPKKSWRPPPRCC